MDREGRICGSTQKGSSSHDRVRRYPRVPCRSKCAVEEETEEEAAPAQCKELEWEFSSEDEATAKTGAEGEESEDEYDEEEGEDSDDAEDDETDEPVDEDIIIDADPGSVPSSDGAGSRPTEP